MESSFAAAGTGAAGEPSVAGVAVAGGGANAASVARDVAVLGGHSADFAVRRPRPRVRRRDAYR